MEFLPLKDSDRCPIKGKHFGDKMEDVPASYLFFIDNQPWCKAKYPEIKDYVKRNLKALQDEEMDEHYQSGIQDYSFWDEED